MATYTEKYKLKKPDVNDYVDINDLNGNADIIDQILKKLDYRSVIVSETEPSQDCIWYQVINTNFDNSIIMLETSKLDDTAVYIAEIENKTEKVTNVNENIENEGDVAIVDG